MCGGDAPAFDAVSRWPWRFHAHSPCWAKVVPGQLAKMVNQICIAGLVQGLSEAIAFGQAANLDMLRWT